MKYADLFEKEAGGHIAALRSLLAALEAPDRDADPLAMLKRLRHEAHGLVGVAAAVGLEPICRLMGAVEEVAVALTRAGASPPAALLRAIGQSLDATDAVARAALEGREAPPTLDIDGLVAAIRTGADVT
jgi:chemotaxis protein histidine kinase CheA